MSDKARFLAAPVTEPDIPFPRAEYDVRWTRTRARMAALGIDLLWVSDPSHMCWLTGHRAEWYMDFGSRRPGGLGRHRAPRRSSDARALRHRGRREADRADLGRARDPHLSIEEEGRAFAVAELAARGWLGGPVGLEMAPDWVGGRDFEAPGDPGDLALDPGAVANLGTIFDLPDALGIALLIDTILADDAGCTLLHATPPGLHLC